MVNYIEPPLSPSPNPETILTSVDFVTMTQFKTLVGVTNHDTFKKLLGEFGIKRRTQYVHKNKYLRKDVEKFITLHNAKRQADLDARQARKLSRINVDPSTIAKPILDHTHEIRALRDGLNLAKDDFNNQLADLEQRMTAIMYNELNQIHNTIMDEVIDILNKERRDKRLNHSE